MSWRKSLREAVTTSPTVQCEHLAPDDDAMTLSMLPQARLCVPCAAAGLILAKRTSLLTCAGCGGGPAEHPARLYVGTVTVICALCADCAEGGNR